MYSSKRLKIDCRLRCGVFRADQMTDDAMWARCILVLEDAGC